MKESAGINSTSLQWLLEFNVNELFTEDDTDNTNTPATEPTEQPPSDQSDDTEIMSVRKSTRVRTCSKRISYSEEEYDMDPSPPPAVARFEECSSSSSETASDGSDKKQKKRRVSKNAGKYSSVSGTENISTTVTAGNGPDESNKPRCTYTELIEKALHENPEGLTVSQIYSWIAKNHAFFRLDDDRWKNSVRHNLSINPYFEKRGKCKNGAGHVWTIAESCRKNLVHEFGVEDYQMDTHEKRAQFAKHDRGNGSLQFKTETERIVGGILQQYKIELNNNKTQHQDSNGEKEKGGRRSRSGSGEAETEEGEVETNAHSLHASAQSAAAEPREMRSQSPIVNEHEDLLITTGIPTLRQSEHFEVDGEFSSHNYMDYADLFAPQPQAATVVNSDTDGHHNHHEHDHHSGGFNEFELLTLDALEANNNQDNFIIIASSINGTCGHGGGGDGSGSVAMDTDTHAFYSEHQELTSQLIEIQNDHLFHTKELLLADEDEGQITTMQL